MKPSHAEFSCFKVLCIALSQVSKCTYLACIIADLPMHSPAITEEPCNQANQRSKGPPHPGCRRGRAHQVSEA